ncbi:3-oxoacyl-(acyl-carrier-protein) synthase, mitochondrial [Ananas comosus]|uniref:beta-ketoacyl-[acyl-carrier-protein] synthase I n=1 Tax=Ananas comosus TaxID=4615 RepID=A0A199VN36_ANACO|nr:3-oxoacyl-(acyl-carrier-protein) synthase, mitochondrial [Ananas comosus]
MSATTAKLLRRLFSSAPLPPPPRAAPLRRVVVTGLGAVTPLGCGVGPAWRALVEGRCGVRALAPSDLRMDGFDEAAVAHTYDQLPSKVAAAVPRGKEEGEFDEDAWIQSKDNKSVARFIAYALCATDEALRDANWLPTEVEKKERTGPNHAAVTACATGAHSIGDAARMIQFGDADVMIAGGTESSIDALSIAGFSRQVSLVEGIEYKVQLSPQFSRPFDCGRDGFVIGEGSGVMVLESLDHAKERGAKIYAEVRGYGMSGDAHHITQPQSDGKGAILSMKRALEQSGLHPSQVDYVNAHATSTPLGDAVEAHAIMSVFSDHATSGALALSSTKGATGHLLGAAGSVEAIFTVLAIHHGIAPPTLNLERPDPAFEGEYMPLSAAKTMQIRAALSNSFGFGGTNASLLFSAPP